MKRQWLNRMFTGIACVAGLLLAAPAYAQGGNSECLTPGCGSPNMNGGGTCSCSCGCSVWVNQTDRGKYYGFDDDRDGDGVKDAVDDCPDFFDPQQDALLLNNGQCPRSNGQGANGDPLQNQPIAGNHPATQPTDTTTEGGQDGELATGCSMLQSHLATTGLTLFGLTSILLVVIARGRRRASRRSE
jgi:hypothetical protein